MASGFVLILNMSLTASIIICLILLARLFLRKLPKIYSYVLWSVVLFRLLCPVSLSLPISILAPFSEASSQSSEATSTMEYISFQSRRPVSISMTDVVGNTALFPSDTDSAGQVKPTAAVTESNGNEFGANPTRESTPMTNTELILTICGWVWASGIAAISALTIYQHFRLKKLLATACILRGNVYESEEIDTAFVMGVFSPKIYLPNGLPFDVQKAVLLHEQTHQARGDNIVKVIAYIALTLHWFNPLVWLAYKLACDDMEKSCDEAVIRGMTKRGYDIKSVKYEYGKMLVALGSGQWSLFSPVSFAENKTKARVMNVATYKKVAVKSILAVTLACATVLAAGIINPKSIMAQSTEQDSNTIKTITINGEEYQTNAKELYFENIDDLSFLKDFHDLTSLYLYNRQLVELEDWSYLSECANLRELNVYGTNTIEFLKYCPDLETLGIGGEYVHDYSPLSYLKGLRSLHISDYEDEAPDMSAIAACTGLQELTTDYAVFEKIAEFDGEMKSLRNLRSLSLTYYVKQTETQEYIYDKKLDISLLAKLPNLKSLSLSRFSLNSFESVEAFEDLDSVTDFEFYAIDDLPSLEFMDGMSNLRRAIIMTDEIKFSVTCDISALGRIKTLEEIYISFPFILCNNGTLSGLRDLKKFCAIYNEDKGVTLDLAFLNEMTGLESLCLDISSDVKDLSPISQLTNLNYLEVRGQIDGNEVMSRISGLTNLEGFQISRMGREIMGYEDLDITPLSYLSKLELIGIDGFRCDLAALNNNQNIKLFFGRSVFSNLEQFREEHPDCEIMIESE